MVYTPRSYVDGIPVPYPSYRCKTVIKDHHVCKKHIDHDHECKCICGLTKEKVNA